MPKKKTSSTGSLKKSSQELEKKTSSTGSLNKLSQEVEKKPAIQQTKQVPKPGKSGKEIDDIFGGRKKKKLDKPEEKESKQVIAKRNRKRKRNEGDGFNKSSKTRPRKRTEDGLPVYTEDELGVNKTYAGGTPLCPFDCDCCF